MGMACVDFSEANFEEDITYEGDVRKKVEYAQGKQKILDVQSFFRKVEWLEKV